MSPISPNEKRFEEHIEKELNSLGYSSRNYKDYDKELCLTSKWKRHRCYYISCIQPVGNWWWECRFSRWWSISTWRKSYLWKYNNKFWWHYFNIDSWKCLLPSVQRTRHTGIWRRAAGHGTGKQHSPSDQTILHWPKYRRV